MSIFVESGIEFDFSQAMSSRKFDEINRVFPSIDMLIEETHRQLWVEIKSWADNVIPARRRGGQRRSFIAKMKSKEFSLELRNKFTGTCAYLTLTGSPPNAEICYIVLLESNPLDSALRTHLMGKMQNILRTNSRNAPWNYLISVAVVDTAEWNARLPQYPAKPVTI